MDNTSDKEDMVTKAIEKQTIKVPSDVFLFTALGALGISLGLKLAGKKDNSAFVGQWVAPILIMGVYNKLVKHIASEKK